MTHINNSYASSINRLSRSYRIFSQHIKNVHNIILTINNTFLPTVITKNQKQRLTIPTPQGPNFYPALYIHLHISPLLYRKTRTLAREQPLPWRARAALVFFDNSRGPTRAREIYIPISPLSDIRSGPMLRKLSVSRPRVTARSLS